MSRQRILLMGVLVFFLIGSMLPSSSIVTISSIPKAHAVSHSIKLTGAFYSGWNGTNPGPTITVTKGDSVSMTLVSGDGAPHTFIIDVAKAGVVASPNCAVDKCSSQFTTTTNYPFTVDFGPGTYAYYCSVHLTAMVGTFMVPGPDYSVSTNPSSLMILQGAKANSTVSITSLNNFAGSVTLSSSSSSPPGLLTSSFNVNPVIVPASGMAKSNFTISVPTGTPHGSYSITVTAKNSTTFSHSATISVTVPTPDFSITPSPASLTISSGASGTSTLTVTGSDGFSGTVSLATTVPPGLATATPNPTSVTLSPTTTSAASTLTVSSALGKFNVTITATNGTTTHSTKVLVNGADFSITTASTTVSVIQGSSSTLMITLSSVNGFSGSVALSASSSTGGPSLSVSPASLQVPSSGSVSATLTVTASPSGAYSTPVSPGSYTITLNATMGPLSHTETIPVTVTSSSPGVGILANPIVIGGIVAAVVVVGIVAYALSRRTKK